MTYLVITSKNDIEDDSIKALMSTLWNKEIDTKSVINNPDLHLLDGTEENSIGIEEVKSLQEEMRYKPFQESVQIAIILDAKKLTTQAQNAFLKTLEESSDSTIYILLAENEKDLLPTIVSRAKKIYSKSKNDENIGKNRTDVCFDNDDLIYCFSVFEKVSKDKIETLLYLDTYLNSLQDDLRNGIKEGRDIDRVTKKISLVNITKGQVNANGNRRLLLENLYLQIQNISELNP